MSDTVTILTSSTGHSLSKAFIGESFVSNKFNPGTTFTASEVTVKDLDSFAVLLRSLEPEPTQTIIRGSSISDATGVVTRTKDQFRPAKRQWCMIDIDSLEWGGDINDQQAMLAHAIQQLPIEFQSVDCWYHFSSSMGIKPGIRVHLWFWLDRPCSDDEMKAWLSGYPVDLRLFNPIQIQLTANPRFIDGAVDPYPNRSGLFSAASGVSTVRVPSDLATRSTTIQAL